jgi:hypothetical protein
MGYRISLYRCPKEDVDAIRNITDEDYDKSDGDILDVLEKDRIKYDTLAHVLDTGTEVSDGFCSRIFTNELSIECDMSFYTISKEQLKKIIERIREYNIFEWQWENTVDYDDKVIGEKIHGPKSWEKPTFDEAVRMVCIDARFRARMWNDYYIDDDGSKKFTNIDLSDNKWWITNGMGYEYCIFNFIHILKCFDWDNDYLVAIGG